MFGGFLFVRGLMCLMLMIFVRRLGLIGGGMVGGE